MAVAMVSDQFLTSLFNYNFIETGFYLIPITVAAWFGGTTLGVLVLVPALVGVTLLNYSQMAHRHSDIWRVLPGITFFTSIEMSMVLVVISKLRSYIRKYHHFASVDELTGCLNARAFRHECEVAIERLKRSQDTHLSVMYIDVDDFKVVNDTKGHRFGDETLRTLGKVLRESVRLVDVIGRVGGDEFAILLPDAAEGDVPIIVGRIHDAMREAKFPTTISIGHVTYPPGVPKDLDEVFHRADQEMYLKKRSRKRS